jgi:hypothetical protein
MMAYIWVWCVGANIQQFARIQVGHVKAEIKIAPHNLNLEWNHVFAVGEDKVQGRTLELIVWDAVHAFPSFASL